MPRDEMANPPKAPRANRYKDVGERLEAQKRYYREKGLREWLAELEAHPGPDYCYFIGGDEGLIKIGFSRQPARRLYQIQRDTPDRKVRILARVGGGREREAYYHRLFEQHHRSGEWFERTPELLAEIERPK